MKKPRLKRVAMTEAPVRMVKDVCKACLNAAVPTTDWHGEDWREMFWDKQNDVVWKMGRTCCPCSRWEEIPNKIVPRFCSHHMEHLVLGQKLPPDR
jgi:hypothetical protein